MTAVDTSVLVHATFTASFECRRAQDALKRVGREGSLAVPRQVFREYVAVVTRRQFAAAPLSIQQAFAAVDAFRRMLRLLSDGDDVWLALKGLAADVAFSGKQVHDANIVATMLAHGESRLLTFDRHFDRFGRWITVVVP